MTLALSPGLVHGSSWLENMVFSHQDLQHGSMIGFPPGVLKLLLLLLDPPVDLLPHLRQVKLGAHHLHKQAKVTWIGTSRESKKACNAPDMLDNLLFS